jgi:hypothetical protein
MFQNKIFNNNSLFILSYCKAKPIHSRDNKIVALLIKLKKKIKPNHLIFS